MSSLWAWIFWVELAVVAGAGWAWTWWRCRHLLQAYRDRAPTTAAASGALQVESWVWVQADEKSAAQRAQLRRSLEQLREASQMTAETSTEASATCMTLTEGLAGTIASATRLLGEADRESFDRADVQSLLDQMRALDPTVGELLEVLDRVDSGLQTLVGEVDRYGSGYDWDSLRPSIERLNLLLSQSDAGGSAGPVAQAVQLPPALAQAIDQAII